MLTKKELNQIRKLQYAINALKAEILSMEIGVQSPSLEDNGSAASFNTKSSVETRALRLVEVRKLLEEKENECESLKLRLHRQIVESDDEILNSILTYRFILRYSWGQTAWHMAPYSSDYLRKYYSKSIPS